MTKKALEGGRGLRNFKAVLDTVSVPLPLSRTPRLQSATRTMLEALQPGQSLLVTSLDVPPQVMQERLSGAVQHMVRKHIAKGEKARKFTTRIAGAGVRVWRVS